MAAGGGAGGRVFYGAFLRFGAGRGFWGLFVLMKDDVFRCFGVFGQNPVFVLGKESWGKQLAAD